MGLCYYIQPLVVWFGLVWLLSQKFKYLCYLIPSQWRPESQHQDTKTDSEWESTVVVHDWMFYRNKNLDCYSHNNQCASLTQCEVKEARHTQKAHAVWFHLYEVQNWEDHVCEKTAIALEEVSMGQIWRRLLGVHNIHLSPLLVVTRVWSFPCNSWSCSLEISILHSMRFIPQFKQRTEKEAAGEVFLSWKTQPWTLGTKMSKTTCRGEVKLHTFTKLRFILLLL